MAPGCAAGRVVRVDLDSIVVATELGDRRARAGELPTVGDWLGDLATVSRTFVLATIAVPIVIYGVMPHLHRGRARLVSRT
jgi:hypothetical protein